MLSKLALKNVKRSIRDYVIYLITVTLAFSLIFSFNAIIFSKDILELSTTMQSFQSTIIVVSSIVVFVIGWLIYYTMKFMFQKRSKEFGTYMLLGIEKKKITKLFLLENILLGLVSLCLSFMIGSLLSQFMTMIIMNIFELPYQVKMSFSVAAILLTLLYFTLIYLFVLWRAYRKIKKMKLYDLLYCDKINEKKIYKTKKSRALIWIISVIAGVTSLYMLNQTFHQVMDNTAVSPMQNILIILILLIFSIYGITLSFADFLTSFVLKRKKLKYHGNNLFLIRQFTSKVKTMGFTLGTLSLLITLTFLSLNLSNVFYEMFQTQTESSAPYDIMIYNIYNETDKEIDTSELKKLEDYLTYIEKHYTIEERTTYNVYTNHQNKIRKYISDGLLGYQPFECYVKLSDYNHLLKMRNMKEITLETDQFYIHTFRDVSKEIENYLKEHKTLKLGNHTLKSKGFTDYKYTSSWSRGSSFIVIVPDSVIDDTFKIVNQITAINTKEETTEQFAKALNQKFPPKVFTEENEEGYTMQYSIQQNTVKGEIINQNRSMLTIFAFSLMYLAFIFIAVVGTILSIQCLSDSTKYKYRYQTLSKLGVNELEIYRILHKQLCLFFLFPIIYPIFISILSSFSIKIMFNAYMTSDHTILLYVILNIGLFFLIYILYYLATYFGFKKNIEE